MSSSRLPGKSLLPVNSVPLAVLCAQRLMGHDVDLMLVTSKDKSDDILVEEVKHYRITVYRGDLDNVLDRFTGAVRDLDDNDVIVRVTADNPVVDYKFLEILLDLFRIYKVDYLGTASPFDGLPYGLSAEVMSVRSLRKASENASSNYEKEHVTPWMIKNLKSMRLPEGVVFNKDFSHLRCTVDTFDDYINICSLFLSQNKDPVIPSFYELIKKLEGMEFSPLFKVPYKAKNNSWDSKFALGTVQLGMSYGIANEIGKPSKVEAENIINTAIKHGVNWIDTARAYGSSENIVGKALQVNRSVRVVTKLDTFNTLTSQDSLQCVEMAVDNSINQSKVSLGRDTLDVVLMHRWNYSFDTNGIILKKLKEKLYSNELSEIGVSVYHPDEASSALQDKDIKHIQLPFNLFDKRWLNTEFQEKLAYRPDVRIHSRSVFLQGLLISEVNKWPDWIIDKEEYIEKINVLVKQFKRKSKADLCIAYVNAQEWIDSVVVGVETTEQLIECMEVMCEKPLTKYECGVVNKMFQNIEEKIINPSLWD